MQSSVEQHLKNIYPDLDASELAQKCIKAFGAKAEGFPDKDKHLWDQQDALMITYGDSFIKEGIKPLSNLKDFLDTYLEDVMTGVHILPFFPYTSDDGFAVSDYDVVRPDLGDWDDIEEISGKFRFMADVVINHASSAHKWFKQFENGEKPGCDYIKTALPTDDLEHVVRPRPFDLLRPTETPDGMKHVWCTFSHDQVDLDFHNPDVLIEFLKIMGKYIDHGTRIFRLDAVAFLWKEVGTPSIHLYQTHEVIKLMRTLSEMRDETIVLITETNVPNHENIQYFGNANEAHVVYNFSMPPLILHALLTGHSEYLRQWAASMPPLQNGCTYLNFTASHDGVGLRPAEGVLAPDEIDLMLDTIEMFGGRVSTRSIGNGMVKPYEMNITYFDALKGTVFGEDHLQFERFIASQSMMMSMQGIPAFYVHSLLGTPNDLEKLERTQHNRSINRHQWDYDALKGYLDNENSIHARVFNELRRRLAIRVKQPAFHPDATQYMLQPEPGFFGFMRQHKGLGQFVYSVTHLQPGFKNMCLYDLNLSDDEEWVDLISGETLEHPHGLIEFSPYQTMWITQKKFYS